MKQGYNDRLDESLGSRNGKKSQSMKDRRVSQCLKKCMVILMVLTSQCLTDILKKLLDTII